MSSAINIDILKDVIEPINSKLMKTADIAMMLNISEKELKSIIKDHGYIWRGSKYIKSSANHISKKSVSKIKTTYNIDKELAKLVKLQSIIEDVDNSKIIEKAIKKYVSDEAKTIAKKLKNTGRD